MYSLINDKKGKKKRASPISNLREKRTTEQEIEDARRLIQGTQLDYVKLISKTQFVSFLQYLKYRLFIIDLNQNKYR